VSAGPPLRPCARPIRPPGQPAAPADPGIQGRRRPSGLQLEPLPSFPVRPSRRWLRWASLSACAGGGRTAGSSALPGRPAAIRRSPVRRRPFAPARRLRVGGPESLRPRLAAPRREGSPRPYLPPALRFLPSPSTLPARPGPPAGVLQARPPVAPGRASAGPARAGGAGGAVTAAQGRGIAHAAAVRRRSTALASGPAACHVPCRAGPRSAVTTAQDAAVPGAHPAARDRCQRLAGGGPGGERERAPRPRGDPSTLRG
jgi:hypothetical protein